jgi:hypothetical protein
VSERRHAAHVPGLIRRFAGIALAALSTMLAMLPLLVSALQMQAPLSEAEIEQALVDGVHKKLSKSSPSRKRNSNAFESHNPDDRPQLRLLISVA